MSPIRGFVEWFLGVVGAIAMFMGSFILIADADQFVGIGGDISGRVGDISSAWGYGTLAGGAVLLTAALLSAASARGRPRPAVATPLTDLALHAGIFVVVNAVLWAQDLFVGGGPDYAFWVTIPWGVALVVHAVVAYAGRETIEDRSRGGER